MHIMYDVSNLCFYLNNCLNVFIYYNRMPEFKTQFQEIITVTKHKESIENKTSTTTANTQNRHI